MKLYLSAQNSCTCFRNLNPPALLAMHNPFSNTHDFVKPSINGMFSLQTLSIQTHFKYNPNPKPSCDRKSHCIQMTELNRCNYFTVAEKVEVW